MRNSAKQLEQIYNPQMQKYLQIRAKWWSKSQKLEEFDGGGCVYE